jgi:hypothetical protein
MMKSNLVKFAVGVLLAVSGVSPALAECSVRTCETVLITGLYPDLTGVYVKTNGNQNLLSCTTNAGWLRMDINSMPTQAIYSLLLTAHVQNMPLNIRLSDALSACTITYAASFK